MRWLEVQFLDMQRTANLKAPDSYPLPNPRRSKSPENAGNLVRFQESLRGRILTFILTLPLSQAKNPTETMLLLAFLGSGAGEGNRTLVSSLGSSHSTIEPHPLRVPLIFRESRFMRGTRYVLLKSYSGQF